MTSSSLGGSSILDICYGIDADSRDDPHILRAELAMSAMAKAGTAASYLVDFLPWLKYVPEWMPGAKFKRDAREWGKYARDMPEESLRFAEERLVRGSDFRA